jgi:hypothetical protein
MKSLLLILATLYGAPEPAGDWRLEVKACRGVKCRTVTQYVGSNHNCTTWSAAIIDVAQTLVKKGETVKATCYGGGAVRA